MGYNPDTNQYIIDNTMNGDSIIFNKKETEKANNIMKDSIGKLSSEPKSQKIYNELFSSKAMAELQIEVYKRSLN